MEVTKVPELVAFFKANTDPSYISHGEIMDGRAISADRWSEHLEAVLTAEFSACGFDSVTPGQTGKHLVVAEKDGALAGFALLELGGSRDTHHGILHDLVVDRSGRGQGIGGAMLRWVEDELTRLGVATLFLESGEANEGAHRFFERAGYRTSSVTMMKRLGRP